MLQEPFLQLRKSPGQENRLSCLRHLSGAYHSGLEDVFQDGSGCPALPLSGSLLTPEWHKLQGLRGLLIIQNGHGFPSLDSQGLRSSHQSTKQLILRRWKLHHRYVQRQVLRWFSPLIFGFLLLFHSAFLFFCSFYCHFSFRLLTSWTDTFHLIFHL